MLPSSLISNLMPELTREYLDQIVAGLATKADLQGLTTKEDIKNAVKPLATSEQVEELARMVSVGFEDVQRRLDVTEQVREHERKLRLIADALHITF